MKYLLVDYRDFYNLLSNNSEKWKKRHCKYQQLMNALVFVLLFWFQLPIFLKKINFAKIISIISTINIPEDGWDHLKKNDQHKTLGCSYSPDI